jgi:hypothetical protein
MQRIEPEDAAKSGPRKTLTPAEFKQSRLARAKALMVCRMLNSGGERMNGKAVGGSGSDHNSEKQSRANLVIACFLSLQEASYGWHELKLRQDQLNNPRSDR